MNSRIIVIVFICFLCTNIYATKKTLSKEAKTLIAEPTLAKTIAIGKIVVESDTEYFIAEKGWSRYPKKIMLHRDFGGVLVDSRDDLGRKIIFYSLHETNEKDEMKDDSGFVMWVSSERGIKTIEKLAKKYDFKEDINPSWQYCSKDNDCITADSKCNKISINKLYSKIFTDYEKTMSFSQCKSLVRPFEKIVKNKCIDSFCV